MAQLQELIVELGTITADSSTPIELRAAKITDDLMARYDEYFASNPTVTSIGDFATKIKTSSQTPREIGIWWAEVEHLVRVLQDS